MSARLGPQARRSSGSRPCMGRSFPAAAHSARCRRLRPRGGGRRSSTARSRPACWRRSIAAGRLTFAHELIRQTLHDELGTDRPRPPPRAGSPRRSRTAAPSYGRTPPSWRTTSTRRATRSVPEPGAPPRAPRRRQRRDVARLGGRRDPAGARARARGAAATPAIRTTAASSCCRLGEMRLRAGQPDFSEAFADAAALARGRSSSQLARAAIGYAGLYYEAGVDRPEADRPAAGGTARARQDDEQDLRVRVLARLAEILHFAGEELLSMEAAAEAVDIARDLGDDHVLTAALAGRPHLAPARRAPRRPAGRERGGDRGLAAGRTTATAP